MHYGVLVEDVWVAALVAGTYTRIARFVDTRRS
jgi:hypothetical protein